MCYEFVWFRYGVYLVYNGINGQTFYGRSLILKSQVLKGLFFILVYRKVLSKYGITCIALGSACSLREGSLCCLMRGVRVYPGAVRIGLRLTLVSPVI